MTEPVGRPGVPVVVLADGAVVDARDVVARIVGVAVGVVGLGVEVLARPAGRGRQVPVPVVVDAAVGAGAVVVDTGSRLIGSGRTARSAGRPAGGAAAAGP